MYGIAPQPAEDWRKTVTPMDEASTVDGLYVPAVPDQKFGHYKPVSVKLITNKQKLVFRMPS